MQPEKIMAGISKEIETALKAMAKAKTPEEKLAHSEIVKNLCKSLGVFLSFMTDMSDIMGYEKDDDMEEEEPFNF